MRFLFFLLVIFAAFNACNSPNIPGSNNDDFFETTPYNLQIPGGFSAMQIPDDNPLTVEGVYLGKKLFYDPLLSGNNTQACADCHNQKFFFTDSTNQFSIGIDGISGTRNAMPLFNLGWADAFFWDGGAANLESQVLGPMTSEIEMHEDLENVLSELNESASYPDLFYNAFGTDSITVPLIMKAIAQFERTLISGNSRYDKYARNEPGGYLNPQELRGLDLYLAFDKGDCNHCHPVGSTFTDFDYRNTGLDSIPQDLGRYLITLNEIDKGKFKTPSLRNVELTGPYMHDGRFGSLNEVLNFYNTGFHYPSNLDVNLALAAKGRLTEQDISDIIAFLQTLTDYEFITNTSFSAPDN